MATGAITISLLSVAIFSQEDPSEVKNFYHTKNGEMIMNPRTYSEGIRQFLRKEHAFILEQIGDYDVFFEVGCGTAKRAIAVTEKGCQFFGIDINPNYITTSNKFFSKKKIDKAETQLISINDLDSTNFPISKESKTLIYFPFNLLGNLQDFEIVLANMANIGHDFCFSTYRINDTAQAARLRYYQNCGCQEIQYTENPIGDLYRSKDGLHSAAFRMGHMIEMLDMILHDQRKEAVISIHDLTEIGFVISVKNIKDRQQVDTTQNGVDAIAINSLQLQLLKLATFIK
jgi:SAM-dependent methyltransferase